MPNSQVDPEKSPPASLIRAQTEVTEYPHNRTQNGVRRLYRKPITQVVILGLVCLMCPGLFNALNGLGGGGRVDTATSANANAALYATFAFFAFIAGYVVGLLRGRGRVLTLRLRSIHNWLGPRLTLFLGSIGYSLNVAAYLCASIYISCLSDRSHGCSLLVSEMTLRQCFSHHASSSDDVVAAEKRHLRFPDLNRPEKHTLQLEQALRDRLAHCL